MSRKKNLAYKCHPEICIPIIVVSILAYEYVFWSSISESRKWIYLGHRKLSTNNIYMPYVVKYLKSYFVWLSMSRRRGLWAMMAHLSCRKWEENKVEAWIEKMISHEMVSETTLKLTKILLLDIYREDELYN